MKKFLFILLPLAASLFVSAQKDISTLVAAEKDFASNSLALGTKAAFLAFLDSSGWVFENGKAVNGINSWKARPIQSGVLFWSPQTALISTAGDLGFTTGPWTYRASLTDTVTARGQYCTVWHLDKKGQWKFLVDLGVNNVPAQEVTDCSTKSLHDYEMIENPLSSLLQAENDFENRVLPGNSTNNSWDSVYQHYLSRQGILIRNNKLPATAKEPTDAILRDMPKDIQYTVEGSGISVSGDMGYTFGTTVISGKTDNFLRIWHKRRSAPLWVIDAEVLRY